MATPKQIRINFSLSENFRKSSHGKWVLKPEVFTKKAIASSLPEKLRPQLMKHKSEVEDLASEFPEISDPRYRTKEKVFAMQLSVQGDVKWYDVVTSILDDCTSAIEDSTIALAMQSSVKGDATWCDVEMSDRTSTIEDSTMATLKQIRINFRSEDFRKSSHGKWVLKPEVFTKKAIASSLPEKLRPLLMKHKSEVEDLASEFPEISDPRYRTKEKVFAMQLSVKGDVKWYDVVTSILDRTSAIEEPVIDVTGLTRRFTYTGKATTCDWTRYGLKSHFPDYDSTEADTSKDGTITSASGSDGDPESKCKSDIGDDPIEIFIKEVRLDPSTYELPDDTEPVSAIYFASWSPFYRVPVVKIEHDLFAGDDESCFSRLRFITAKSISSTQPIAGLVFEILPGGTFRPGCEHGMVMLTHFSFIAIVLKTA